MSAGTAEDGLLVKFPGRPNFWFVIGNGSMTFEARIPTLAAFEFDRDNVEGCAIVLTASIWIDVKAKHRFITDQS